MLVCATALGRGTVSAQELPPDVVLMMEELLGEQSSDELSILLEELYRRKPDINSMGRDALESTHLLSLFQIESILYHREHFGDILSRGELAVVDGFNARKAELCSHFFSFRSNAPPADTIVRQDSHSAFVKARKTFGTEGVSLTAKYQGEHIMSGEKSFSWNVTLDSDAGEKPARGFLPDFTSACIRYEKPEFRMIAGDFSARFGQGLVLWKGFSIASPTDPSGMIKKGRGLFQYRSTDEADFFRGAGASVKVGSTDISAFISYNALDARIVGDTAYTSITTGGYHRSGSELAKRRSMHEFVAGAGASREFGHWRVGVTAVTYRYDKKNGKSVKDYNRYQIYDGLWGNIGIDFFAHWRGWRFAGEAAVDFGGSCAATASAVWSPVWEFEMSLTGRLYSKSYIATHAGAWSTLSSCSNQRGVTLCCRWMPSDKWTADIQAEYSYYGWPRFNVPGPSQAFRGRLTFKWNFGSLSSADIQIRYSGNLLSGRINASVAASSYLSFEGRLAANEGGMGAFAGGRISLMKGRLSISARATWYNAEDYVHRLYFYESDLPQSFSIKSYWGRGWAGYGMVRYTPAMKNRRMKPELWLKVSQEVSSLFLRFSLN